MRGSVRTVSVWTVLAVALFLACGEASAKDYGFPRVDIDVTVRPDGSFEFREERTFDFRGDFTWAEYYIERTRAGESRPLSVEITDLAIGEGGRPYVMKRRNEIEDSREPGTYWTSYAHQGRYAYARWYYRAHSESRTFEISYVAHDVVTVHDDHAVLYWKFVGGESQKGVRQVTGTIHLPGGADKDRVRAWLHANLTSEYWIEDARTVRFRVDNLAPRTFVELRVLFPPELVPTAPTRVAGAIWERVHNEERRWVEEANTARENARRSYENLKSRRKRAGFASIGIGALALLVWAGLFSRFGKEHQVRFDGDYFRELPAERPPAEVGYLVRSGLVGANDMVATIMDLARRGYLTIREVEHETRGFLGLGKSIEYDYVLERVKEDMSEATGFERSLVTFLFSSRSAMEGFLSLDAFKKEAQRHSTSFHRWFSKWKKLVTRSAEREGLLEKKSTHMSILALVIGIVAAFAGVVISGIGQAPLGIAGVAFGFLTLGLSSLIKRRSPEAALEFQKWKALKRYLLHFSKLDDAPPPSLVLWEHFLVYAVTLGVAKEVIKQLEPIIPDLEKQAGRSFAAGWYTGAASRMTSAVGGITGLSEGLSSMVQVAGSAMSSASGTGGGGTGGGGGGGGGGGAGAG